MKKNLVKIDFSSGNHGCDECLFVQLWKENQSVLGKVVTAHGCFSCWQEGHDSKHARNFQADYEGLDVVVCNVTEVEEAVFLDSDYWAKNSNVYPEFRDSYPLRIALIAKK